MKNLILIMSMFISFGVTAAEKTVTLDVPGMFCPTCPITVKKSLINVDGVKDVKVSLKDKTAIVTYEDEAADVEDLTFATENSGYPSTVRK
ncbi:Mercuric transport protein periplasmic component [Hydrogenovibrio crunogenus]|uniref:Periplasmic mercury ion-binding protein n=1 Tax=Hydrogenovibrio crunogenus TaxID=39765 RepID=A0A4P7P2Q7_9GAMM|nr:mercury resistance system periplasmic binding protein MerP [Hydrogenovibrio crunogenus]QBZ84155.1 Mercuric transport protein periplasmic component [Hydrogenovibrio crunogenus]